MFPSITAQAAHNNATLQRAREIQSMLVADGLSKNPRIFADEFIFGGCLIPEKDTNFQEDVPDWADENWDQKTTLATMGVPSDLPVYLVIFVVEGGPNNFVDVAEIDDEMLAQGKTLAQAVNLAKSNN